MYVSSVKGGGLKERRYRIGANPSRDSGLGSSWDAATRGEFNQ